MDDFNTYEYTVEQKPKGKWLVFRILMITLYVIYSAVYFTVIFTLKIIPLGALIPLTLWVIIYFTWRYVKPDYKYTVERGCLTFAVIYGGKSKREKTSVKLSAAEAIAPAGTLVEKIKAFSPEKIYNALPTKSSSDAYAVLYKDSCGKNCVLYFMATNQALKLIRHYNSNTVIVETAY